MPGSARGAVFHRSINSLTVNAVDGIVSATEAAWRGIKGPVIAWKVYEMTVFICKWVAPADVYVGFTANPSENLAGYVDSGKKCVFKAQNNTLCKGYSAWQARRSSEKRVGEGQTITLRYQQSAGTVEVLVDGESLGFQATTIPADVRLQPVLWLYHPGTTVSVQ
ncbi:unnamed protein product, partial [Symbiodinium sp. KB8]